MKKPLSLLLCLLPTLVSAQTFKPTVKSLEAYETPAWFADAKFGLWTHWTAYAVTEQGDWYARNMYIEGHRHYNWHVKNYGHPSKVGYRSVIENWKADKFDADELVGLFKQAGAKYVVSLANHHDNFDLWDSKHHEWNSVKHGPKVDIVGEMRKATLKHGLRFGVTTHLERTWSWFQVNKGSDKKGAFAGVPYDGNDPKYESLYLKKDPEGDTNRAHPTNAPKHWREHWLARCKDLIDNYQPDLFYVDGGVPFYGDDKGQTGLEMISHLYNQNASWHGGKNEAVMCVKHWEKQKGKWGYWWDGIATLDVERGRLKSIHPEPWQTDTSIGDWVYKKGQKYRSSQNVIHELIDIVSKNGNLLLNIPQKADGSIDAEAKQLLLDVGAWMKVNGEAIYGTRPWHINREGSLRFLTKGKSFIVHSLKKPSTTLTIKSAAKWNADQILHVELLGHGKLSYKFTTQGLEITVPKDLPQSLAYAFKISSKVPASELPLNK